MEKENMEANDHETQPNAVLEQVRGFCRDFIRWTSWRPWEKRAPVTTVLCFMTTILLLGAFVFSHLNNYPNFWGQDYWKSTSKIPKESFEITYSPSLNCSLYQGQATCPADYISIKPSNQTHPDGPSNLTCPEYFRWIHEDLRHWKRTGITREMIERARGKSNFRVVILNGRLYVETYSKAFQTRDLFTLWGFVQLLRWYPGRVPDLELMFNCDDPPAVRSNDYKRDKLGPPPLFKYCSDRTSLDISFPDWSFWGWAETNIKPWRILSKDIIEANKGTKWEDRVPLAYWRGNPYVAATRGDLMKCNVSDTKNWNALLYLQDWGKETQQGFKESNLVDQCTHRRYKIYIEGRAWSVSEKYILACDSPTLYVDSSFYEFFTRGMEPMQHYWPIRTKNKCKSLKFAVEWGNNHSSRAQEIGKDGSNFILEYVKMEYVYDYMFHLLNEYAKLLRFQPSIPPTATEMCPESMACPADGIRKEYLTESWEKSPSQRMPCTLPPPYGSKELKALVDKRGRSIKQVEAWENEYWNDHSRKQ